jgi:hypothetical protein
MTFVVAVVFDLATFVALAPLAAHFEIGYIGAVYLALGTAGAVAWKLAGAAVILAGVSIGRDRHPRLATAVLVIATIGSLVGGIGNSVATWQVAEALGA